MWGRCACRWPRGRRTWRGARPVGQGCSSGARGRVAWGRLAGSPRAFLASFWKVPKVTSEARLKIKNSLGNNASPPLARPPQQPLAPRAAVRVFRPGRGRAARRRPQFFSLVPWWSRGSAAHSTFISAAKTAPVIPPPLVPKISSRSGGTAAGEQGPVVGVPRLRTRTDSFLGRGGQRQTPGEARSACFCLLGARRTPALSLAFFLPS